MKPTVSIGSSGWVCFFRPVPAKFDAMRIPNGIVTSNQMRVLGEVVQRHGDDGNADITTRRIFSCGASD